MEAFLITLISILASVIIGLVGWIGSRIWIKVDRLSSAIEQLGTLYAVHIAEHETLALTYRELATLLEARLKEQP